MNNVKKTISMIAVCAALFALVSLGVIAQTKSKHRPAAKVTPIVCKENDEDCFIQAAETCRKANLTRTGSVDLLGMFTTTSTFYQEIRGGRNGNCTTYFRAGKAEVKFTAEFIRKMKESGATVD